MKIRERGRGRPGVGSQAGSALVLSLLAVTSVVFLASSFIQFASSVANRQSQAAFRKQAFYMAEAGLAEAYAGLMIGKSGNVGSPEAPARFGNGLFWVEATEVEPGVVSLESHGMIGAGQATLTVVAKRGEASVASLGVFADQGLVIAPGSTIDAYDSTKGSYASQTDHTGAQLGSNAAVQLSGTTTLPTVVKGDVTPGPAHTVAKTGTVTITGSTDHALSSTPFPAVELPELTLGATQVHNSPYPLVIAPGEVGYQGLTVKTGAQVLIQGPAQVVLGSLAVEAGAELAFDTTHGAVELFVTDALTFASSSMLTTSSSDPQLVVIQVPGETAAPLQLSSSTQFHGVLYAPEAEITVGGGFEVFGSLVGSHLTFSGPAKMHFDKHLAQVAAEAKLPRMVSWWIVDLASTSGDLSTNPFDVLGVDPTVLPPPSKAHADQTLSIHYYDAASVYHTYEGLESHFDWNVVKSVISAERDGEEVLFPRATTPKTGVAKKPTAIPVVDGPMI